MQDNKGLMVSIDVHQLHAYFNTNILPQITYSYSVLTFDLIMDISMMVWNQPVFNNEEDFVDTCLGLLDDYLWNNLSIHLTGKYVNKPLEDVNLTFHLTYIITNLRSIFILAVGTDIITQNHHNTTLLTVPRNRPLESVLLPAPSTLGALI